MSGRVNNIVKELALTKTNNRIFNPYNELSKSTDDRTAPGVRQQNLRLYLNTHLKNKTKVLWVYSSPTFLEAKRSGVPLLNESLFSKAEGVLKPDRHFEVATKSKKRPDNTVISSVIWDVAEELGINPIIWPAIPFYTHRKGKVKAKRKPTMAEIIKYKHFLENIIALYKPDHILAIGREAEQALKSIGIKPVYVNHPRSGKGDFANKVKKYIK